MREQHSAIVGEGHINRSTCKKAEVHPYAVVTVAMGRGFRTI